MTQEEREALRSGFEAWYTTTDYYISYRVTFLRGKTREYDYKNVHTEDAWNAWCAAKEHSAREGKS